MGILQRENQEETDTNREMSGKGLAHVSWRTDGPENIKVGRQAGDPGKTDDGAQVQRLHAIEFTCVWRGQSFPPGRLSTDWVRPTRVSKSSIRYLGATL